MRLLSQGGMGEIYLARQRSTGKDRAIKLILPPLAANPILLEYFVREAKVGASIHSEHVVEVIAAGVDEGTPWLAMEMLVGKPLSERAASRGPLPPAEVLTIFQQLCHALGAAHLAGVVHRDLKPENIFIAESRRPAVPFTVKILDFGIAKLIQERGTASTGVFGTPEWMAPEQWNRGDVGPVTDVWALGLIAFRLLAGRGYWLASQLDAPPPQAFMVEILHNPLELASLRSGAIGGAHMPAGFDAWFARCVDRAPTNRFGNAHAAFAALEPILDATCVASFKATRADLAVHRRALADTALALYPVAAELLSGAPWPLLGGASWRPRHPCPIDDVIIDFRADLLPASIRRDPAFARAAAELLPPRAGGSYQRAVHDSFPEVVLFNDPCFRLLDATFAEGSPPRLAFGPATYFEYQDESEVLAIELCDAHRRSLSHANLPLRSAVGDPFAFDRRVAATGCNVVTIVASDRKAMFYMHQRSSGAVAEAQGVHHVVPAGQFAPDRGEPATREQCSLWRTVRREYAEELWLGRDRYRGRADPDFDGALAKLDEGRVRGAVRPFFLGLGLDPLTLKVELLFVTIFDLDFFFRELPRLLPSSSEGDLVYRAATRKGYLAGVPWSRAEIARYAGPGATLSTLPAGAAALLLANAALADGSVPL